METKMMTAEINIRLDKKSPIELRRFDFNGSPNRIVFGIKQATTSDLNFFIDLRLARKIIKALETMLKGEHGQYVQNAIRITIDDTKIK